MDTFTILNQLYCKMEGCQSSVHCVSVFSNVLRTAPPNNRLCFHVPPFLVGVRVSVAEARLVKASLFEALHARQ